MRRSILYFILIILVGIFLYVYYFVSFNKIEKDTWSYVPSNSFLVYETFDFPSSWNNLKTTSFWKTLKSITEFESIEYNLSVLDTISSKKGNLEKVLKDRGFLISAHNTARGSFDFVYYISVTDRETNRINEILDEVSKNENISAKERVYQGISINELVIQNKTFSYLIYENHFISSFTPFLIEDVIRTFQSDIPRNFTVDNQKVREDPISNQIPGTIFINSANFSDFMNGFASNRDLNSLGIKNLANNFILDINISSGDLQLSGFSFKGSLNRTYLDAFSGQMPGEIDLISVVPNRTSSLYYQRISNGESWGRNLAGLKIEKLPLASNWDELTTKYEFDIGRFFRWLHGEIGLLTLEAIGNSEGDRCLFVQANDYPEALNQLNKLTELVNKKIGDSVYIENYRGVEIRLLNLEEFPSKLLGPIFKGFDVTYYGVFENYILFADNIETIKSIVTDYEQENTWGKSIDKIRFFESTVDQTNLSIIINVPRSWEMIMQNLSTPWREYFQRYNRQFQQFEMIAFQISQTQGNYFTTFSIDYTENLKNSAREKFELIQKASLDSVKVVTPPSVVMNHQNRTFEVIVQDANKYLNLISSQGEILWRDSIGTEIVTEITQIDFYKNRRLQYLFGTKDAIHLIDRNGNYIDGYPIKLKYDQQNLQLIDYDGSKNYRFLSYDAEGNLYLFDKIGTNLPGWQPKAIGGPLAAKPQHIRVRNRDVIIVIQKSGLVHVLNRRGEIQKDFPLDLKLPFNSELFIEVGQNFRNTILTGVSTNGIVIKFDLEGLIQSRHTLFKPSPNVSFKLVKERRQRSFIIAQQDQNRLSILDKSGRLLMEKDYINSIGMDVQYYDFGSGKRIYAATDQIQEFTYLYDSEGNLINYQPLESGYSIAMIYYGSIGKVYVYHIYQTEISISAFPF